MSTVGDTLRRFGGRGSVHESLSEEPIERLLRFFLRFFLRLVALFLRDSLSLSEEIFKHRK